MYESNVPILKRIVAEHDAITYQRNLKFGEEGRIENLNRWNRIMTPFEKIPLWEEGKTPGYDDRDKLQPEPYIVFIPAPEHSGIESTILVAHGGGFRTRTAYEGINVANWFHDAGFNTAILTYRLDPYNRLDSLADIQRAVRVLRMNKEKLGISDRIAAMGFSAGGMLAATLATHFDEGKTDAGDPAERISCRPDAAVICYGAFSLVTNSSPVFPARTVDPMFGRTREEAVRLAPEVNVSPDCPPFFIWQTLSDDGRHGLTLARALNNVGVPYELHIFQSGIHGIALADGENDPEINDEHCAHWTKLCSEWLAFNGF